MCSYTVCYLVHCVLSVLYGTQCVPTQRVIWYTVFLACYMVHSVFLHSVLFGTKCVLHSVLFGT